MSVHFDQIRQMPGLRMAYRVGGRDQRTGLLSYEVLAAVPLASLGLTDPAGRRIGFDASIAVANAAGDRRERAGHWAGQSEGVVVDRPGSAATVAGDVGNALFRAAIVIALQAWRYVSWLIQEEWVPCPRLPWA